MQYLWCHMVHTIYSKLQLVGCTLAVWEGPTELLLAKVKNASGIFYVGRLCHFFFFFFFETEKILCAHSRQKSEQ